MPQVIYRPRDLEILRTLLRLRYVTGRELRTQFFLSDDAGAKRLKVLCRRLLITPHTKGIAPGTNYSAWRLTPLGLELVMHKWPSEPVPDGLIDRLENASLVNLHHREATNAIYFEYLRGNESVPESQHEVAPWNERVTARANSIVWQPDGDVVLQTQRLSQKLDILPDAVITSKRKATRLFVELDRSTKPLTRVRENLERYGTYLRERYRDEFTDEKTPQVVYVVRSPARKAHVANLFKQVFAGRFTWKVLETGRTASWMVEQLGTAAPAPVPAPAPLAPTPSELRALAKRTFFWTNDLLKEIKNRGWLDQLDREMPAFITDGRATLIALLDELKKEARHDG